MSRVTARFLVLFLLFVLGVQGGDNLRRAKQNGIPKYYYAPDTTRYCVWWLDNADGDWTCQRIEEELEISMIDFHEWNPSAGKDCTNLPALQSYCVAAVTEPATPILGANGVATPLPAQPSMVTNCATFYYVRRGDTCEAIAKRHMITTGNVVAWNPGARRDCTMLLAGSYACVGVL
ncbi:hypothetical protein QBC34DRAFT_296382 [Podospora aff. communis PSN243]|uniref:LysM domain-containing protein n=1 Tax=Podospora aff. communis PSN243 TaxID=3040156 RepID=A0AAV9GTP7_9PEZI|nr:hypothetical protein QBC34DRAFT_296382 [Podospora aff. communis PSN243]